MFLVDWIGLDVMQVGRECIPACVVDWCELGGNECMGRRSVQFRRKWSFGKRRDEMRNYSEGGGGEGEG